MRHYTRDGIRCCDDCRLRLLWQFIEAMLRRLGFGPDQVRQIIAAIAAAENAPAVAAE